MVEKYGHAHLMERIKELKADKLRQELSLQYSLRALIDTLDPFQMVKRSLHQLAEDKQLHFDIATVGLNLGANLIVDGIFGKPKKDCENDSYLKTMVASLLKSIKDIF